MREMRPTRLSWKAAAPEGTRLELQLRWAQSRKQLDSAPWRGPSGEGSVYEQSGADIEGVEATSKWLQYRASLISPNGCRSPGLEEVRVDFDTWQ
jgi:hypothetical protein